MSVKKSSRERQGRANVRGKQQTEQQAEQRENPRTTYDILVEIGSEELPPLELRKLEKAFGDGVWEGLKQSGVINSREGAEVHTYATPRRLAVQVLGVHKKAEHKGREIQEIKGPPIARAYDDSGIPATAGIGFAKNQGIREIPPLKSLAAFDDNKELEENASLVRKGDYLIALKETEQPDLQDILPEVIRKALKELPAKRTMRWGDGDEEWVRPVHWAVLLLDKRIDEKLVSSEAVETSILGLTTGNTTRGHRFMAPDAIKLENVESYKRQLRGAKVIADFTDRRQAIVKKLDRISVLFHEFLINEITALVEWPVVLQGEFDKKFLKLPVDIIVAVMQHHQRYLPVYDGSSLKKKLIPHFNVVTNIDKQALGKEHSDLNKIVAGNERVLRARLEDADFFFTQDRKRKLEEHRDDLKGVVFRHGLGTMYDKSERMGKLAAALAKEVNINPQIAMRAAHLAKADLATAMVREFPQLQGAIGSEYARLDEASKDEASKEVAWAIEEHYLPQGQDDRLPLNEYGAVLALADRLDTVAGFFGTGMKPGGSGDPFGLRRAALAILRLLMERDWDLDLRKWLRRAHNGYGELLPQGKSAEASVEKALNFIMGRLIGLYQEERIPKEVFTMVNDLRLGRPLNVSRRVRAVQSFSLLAEAEALSIAHKRASNILSKQAEKMEIPQAVEQDLLAENTEKALFNAIAAKRNEIDPLLKQEKYVESLKSLASLKPLVDSFFDEVLVMTDDQTLRNNRLALLQSLCKLFSDVAGIPLVDTGRADLERGLFEYDTEPRDPKYLKGLKEETYYRVRDPDNPWLLKAKNLCLDLWPKFEPFADSNFKSAIKKEFSEKFWEMYLAVTLIDNDFQLVLPKDKVPGKDKNKGPDILISENGQRRWIEAIVPDKAKDEAYTQADGKVRTVDHDKIILRYTSAIKEKFCKYKRYRKEGIIKDNEPFIIAVNGCRVPYARGPYVSIPDIVKAVYPAGNSRIYFNKYTKQKMGESHEHRPDIEKGKGGSKVPTYIFLCEKYKDISGILFSMCDCANHTEQLGDDFIFIHNYMASNPIENGYFKIGEEYFVDNEDSEGFDIGYNNWRKTGT